MNEIEKSLSLEQKLHHRIFSDRVQQLSQEQAQELLIQMHKQMILKDNLYKKLFLSREKEIVDSLLKAKNN